VGSKLEESHPVTIRIATRALASALILASTACKTAGEFVWVDDLPQAAPPAEKEYVIQSGDIISVRVWNQEGMSARARVRQDGKISLPFLNDVEVSGLTPTAAAKRIQARLKEFIVNPVVNVSLEETRPVTVAVLGEVVHPGNYPIDATSGVMHALALAGGMTPYASKDMILVIRQKPDGGTPLRIRFTYEALTQAKGRAASFRLQSGDVVVVE
jgi:polysaccharide export outer membrane protein